MVEDNVRNDLGVVWCGVVWCGAKLLLFQSVKLKRYQSCTVNPLNPKTIIFKMDVW